MLVRTFTSEGNNKTIVSQNISETRLSYALSCSIMYSMTTQSRIWPAQVVDAGKPCYNVIEYDNQPNEGGETNEH